MACPKGIVAIDICHPGKLRGKIQIPRLLPGMKSKVLEQQYFASCKLRQFLPGILPHRVTRTDHVCVNELIKSAGDRRQV